MERLTKKYVKVLHKPIITNTKFDILIDRYRVENNHLYEFDYDNYEEEEMIDLGEIIAMSDNKEDLIKLQKYTRIEKSKLNEMNAYITEHKKIEQELGFDLKALLIVLKLKDGDIVYHKNDIDGIVQCKVEQFFGSRKLNKYGYYVVDGIGYTPNLYPENYGKTWALTKEELEK